MGPYKRIHDLEHLQIAVPKLIFESPDTISPRDVQAFGPRRKTHFLLSKPHIQWQYPAFSIVLSSHLTYKLSYSIIDILQRKSKTHIRLHQ